MCHFTVYNTEEEKLGAQFKKNLEHRSEYLSHFEECKSMLWKAMRIEPNLVSYQEEQKIGDKNWVNWFEKN